MSGLSNSQKGASDLTIFGISRIGGASFQNVAFIFTVKTDNTGTSNNDQFTLPLTNVSQDFYIGWGDGSQTDHITVYNQAEATHTFSGGAGTYTIRVRGLIQNWKFEDSGDEAKLLEISQFGSYSANNLEKMLEGCSNLIITATDAPNTVGNTTMFRTFRNNSNLVEVPSIENWDHSLVTSWNSTFLGNGSFTQDLSNLPVTSTATNLNGMLRNTSVDFSMSLWDVSGMTTATNFLEGVTLSTNNYDATLAAWINLTLQSSVSIHFGNSEWGFGYGGQARYDLISVYAWTITDGGQNDSTMSVWLNAHNVLGTTANPVDGTPVSSWKDLSDNANNADQATVGNQPLFKTNILNGEPVVRFDGVDDRLEIADATEIQDIFSAANGSYIFAVVNLASKGEVLGRIISKYTSGGNARGTILEVSDGSAGFLNLTFEKSFSTTPGKWTASDVITLNQTAIICIHYDDSSVSNDPVIYVNSKTASSLSETSTPIGTSDSDVGTNLTIGNSQGANRTLDGDVAEIAINKNKALDSSYHEDVLDYFADKYGAILP